MLYNNFRLLPLCLSIHPFIYFCSETIFLYIFDRLICKEQEKVKFMVGLYEENQEKNKKG